MIKGNTRTRGMMQGASRSNAVAALNYRRQRRAENEDWKSKNGPVVVTRIQERHPEEETGLVDEDG